jgi:hypothetical protein
LIFFLFPRKRRERGSPRIIESHHLAFKLDTHLFNHSLRIWKKRRNSSSRKQSWFTCCLTSVYLVSP